MIRVLTAICALLMLPAVLPAFAEDPVWAADDPVCHGPSCTVSSATQGTIELLPPLNIVTDDQRSPTICSYYDQRLRRVVRWRGRMTHDGAECWGVDAPRVGR